MSKHFTEHGLKAVLDGKAWDGYINGRLKLDFMLVEDAKFVKVFLCDTDGNILLNYGPFQMTEFGSVTLEGFEVRFRLELSEG